MKNAITILVVISSLLVFAGCSSTLKSETVQTVNSIDANGNPVQVVTTIDNVTPKDIAHEGELVNKHATCRRPAEVNATNVSLGLIRPMELKSGAAQAEYIEAVSDGQLMNLTQMAIANMAGDPEAACHKAIATEATAYYMMEAKRSSNRWGFGKFLAGTAAAYFIVSEWSSALASAASNGDINIGSINQTKSDDPTSGEGTGGGVEGSQVLNIGSGNVATGQGMTNETVDKAMHTTFKDAESNLDGSGSPSGVVLEDGLDGSGNSGKLF